MNHVTEQEDLNAAEAELRANLRRAFERVAAQLANEQSVEFAFEAQREVVLGVDRAQWPLSS